jgi:hypothetical protein
MSRDRWISYRRARKGRWRGTEQRHRERIRVVRQMAESYIRLLVDPCGVRKEYLFGSLAGRRRPHDAWRREVMQ